MYDNAKFCMECGAKLSEYTSVHPELNDNIIQRSAVGAASVGNVNISAFDKSRASKTGDICPNCGFEMKDSQGGYDYVMKYKVKNGNIVDVKTKIGINGKICPKCKYKCVYSANAINIYPTYVEMCPSCGGGIDWGACAVWNKKVRCTKCGKKYDKSDEYDDFNFSLEEREKEAAENLGWTLLF
jgi:Zn-finger nucleic acid-binding protein